jgi:hypothetical protein
MSMLHFNDGTSFDTSGPLRIVGKRDGLYVVGNGCLIPIADYAEGEEIINKLSFKKE